MESPPDRRFDPVNDRQTGGKKLNINCSYCSHKKTCWADPGIDMKVRSGRPVFLVKGMEGDKSNAKSF